MTAARAGAMAAGSTAEAGARSAVVDRIPVAGALLAMVAERGVSAGAIARRAGLDAGRLAGPRPRLSTREFFALWAAIEGEAPSDRALGLVLGVQAMERRSSVALEAALGAATLAGGLATLGRYKRLVCPEQVEVVRGRGEASVRFHWLLAGAAVPRLLVDSTAAGLVALARLGTGTALRPRRLELARAPSDRALLEGHFGCDVSFGAPFDRLVLDESALALPFVTRDDRALERLVPGLEAALVEPGGERSFADEVRLAIARHLGAERPTIERVARRLHVSSRTLQRRLGEAATSYQEQLAAVRHQTARRLLARTDLDPTEVAFVLGFEEPNSFDRAFRDWEGTTPRRWRGEREETL